jgi:uncharacterized protein YprB with RNaseH-like and TPR domain
MRKQKVNVRLEYEYGSRRKETPMDSQAKVLVFDIETAPMLAYVFDLRDQNIGLNQIYTDWHVLAWSAKWLGDPADKIMYRDQRGYKLGDDKAILKDLWKLLNEADIVITQNGKHFDSPKLNARFIVHGMPPPKPYTHLDTYQILRSVAKFTSNKLEYITNLLCTRYKKLSHKKFPGFTLWAECMKGNKQAWEEMKKYNIHDVLATEEFYMKIRAWTPSHMANVFHITDKAVRCSTCGATGKMYLGKPKRAKSGLYQQYSCRTCGSWQKGIKVK